MSSWWVSEPNCGRGTFGILSDCLFTIIFAVWTVQHPDTGRTSPLDRVADTLIFLALPEFAAAKAVRQLMTAWSVRNQLRPKFNIERGGKRAYWTLKQSFAIDMGAVHLVYPGADTSDEPPQPTRESRRAVF